MIIEKKKNANIFVLNNNRGDNKPGLSIAHHRSESPKVVLGLIIPQLSGDIIVLTFVVERIWFGILPTSNTDTRRIFRHKLSFNG